MKGDFSRFTNDPSKHYVGAFMQQGRVQLDADLNENVENFLNALWKESTDLLGYAACVGDSFRIGNDIPIDHMLEPELWKPLDLKNQNSSGYIFLNTKDVPRINPNSTSERGSLFVNKANCIQRDFHSLDLSKFKSIYVKFKILAKSSQSKKERKLTFELVLFLKENNVELTYKYDGKIAEPEDDGGFLTAKFELSSPVSAKPSDILGLSNISKISLQWKTDNEEPMCIGIISGVPLATITSASSRDRSVNWFTDLSCYSPISKEDLMFSIYNHKPTIKKRRDLKQIFWEFVGNRNFNALSGLRFAISNTGSEYSFNLLLVDSDGKKTSPLTVSKREDLCSKIWDFYTVDIVNSKIDTEVNIDKIKSIGFTGLPETDLYFSEILGELNPEKDFIISGDSGLNQSARMYVNGVACVSESWRTFLNQADYPQAPSIASSGKKNSSSCYMVYADVWLRGITSLEDPQIRETALGGPDTSTRMKTICQVKMKNIPDNTGIEEKIQIARNEIRKMREPQSCLLSTKFDQLSLNSSGSINVDIGSETFDNRLYRIQIHNGGDDPSQATFKWSRDNASTAFSVQEVNEFDVVLEYANRNIAGVFRIGDLIEIIDDIDELSEQPRGQLKKITEIDPGNRKLSWKSVANPAQPGVTELHNNLETPQQRYSPEYHTKIILWDGIKPVSSEGTQDGYILLDDSFSISRIGIKFESGPYRSGDYWTFTTRSSGQMDVLKSEPPKGPRHEYALLGLVRKEDQGSIRSIEDFRRRSQPTTDLRAVDISYEDGRKHNSDTRTVQAALQNLFENRTRILAGRRNDPEDGSIDDLHIEAGEIYELKNNENRTFSKKVYFRDDYKHKPFLIYSIRSCNNSDVKHEIHMFTHDEAGNEIHENSTEEGEKIRMWKGFEVEAAANAKISWMSIGESQTQYERFARRIMTENLRLLFGINADDLEKEEKNVLQEWHKNLDNLLGSKFANNARTNWENFVNDIKKVKKDIVNKNAKIEPQPVKEQSRDKSICIKCGNKNLLIATFCAKCGYSLK